LAQVQVYVDEVEQERMAAAAAMDKRAAVAAINPRTSSG
jgi:hypothetical protein